MVFQWANIVNFQWNLAPPGGQRVCFVAMVTALSGSPGILDFKNVLLYCA